MTIALSLVGAFYVFAGFVALRAGLVARLMDHAISKIDLNPIARVDVARTRWMLAISTATYVSGVLLMALLDIALWAFLACATLQAVYILHAAPNVLDKLDAPDARGRRQTINAFVIYAAATAFVAWAWWTGRLVPLAEASSLALALAVALLIGFAGYGLHAARPSQS